MSKSDENPAGSIFLLDDADTITKKIKRAVTDSGTEITFRRIAARRSTNLLTIYQLLTGKSAEECVAHFAGKGYGQFKTRTRRSRRRISQTVPGTSETLFDDESLTVDPKAGAEKATHRRFARHLKNVYAKDWDRRASTEAETVSQSEPILTYRRYVHIL